MIEPRLERAAAAPAFHGGPPASHSEDSRIVIDFSTNVNAFGPPPSVVQALVEADPVTYPDPTAHAARAAFAAWCDLPVDHVAFTAGACDAIDRIARAFLGPGDNVLIAAPAFGEYARAASMAGATVHEVSDCETARTDPPVERMLAAVRQVRPRLVFLASPSSPRGVARPMDEIDAVANAIRDEGVLVLDESYSAFATGAATPPLRIGTTAPPSRPTKMHRRGERTDIVHVRSITKDFALAGVRAGFVVARPEIIHAIRTAGPPWATSAAAQAAAVAAFTPAALEHVAQTIRVLRAERARLAGVFAAHGAIPFPGDTHVVCVRVGHADVVTSRLRDVGIRVRPCESFGWPDVVRVAARRPRENDVLVDRFLEAAC